MAYKTLFLDSDVLLDVVLIRQPHFKNSLGVVELADHEAFRCCASVHSLLNIHYLTKKQLGDRLARQSIAALAEKLIVVTEDADILEQALKSAFSDFEDAVQFYAAKSANADFIITRNTKDYKQSTIPVLTTGEFLRTLL